MAMNVSLAIIVLMLARPTFSFTMNSHQSSRPTRLSLDESNDSSSVIEEFSEVLSTDESDASIETFDYNANWYPVIWAHELVLNEPTKVTVFDVDYVVAKIGKNEVIALEDRCPHKSAALSQGRVTSSGKFQCAYHGWSFDGTSGKCSEIPQIVKPDGTMPSQLSRKSCAKAVPAQIHQKMVWLFPGGGLEEALRAVPPPTIKEVEEMGFQMSTTVRDIPVDWPLIMSNINDADHGLFAHQAKTFDMYSASKDYPMKVTEHFPASGKGYTIENQVKAVDKLLDVDRSIRGRKNRQRQEETRDALSFIQMPSHLHMKRVSKISGKTSFINAFYVCPVGVGRSRLMTAGCMKRAPKNWIAQIFLNNFLDQDSFLVASQQRYVLQQEAADIRKMMDSENLTIDQAKTKRMTTRRDLFFLSSPTDKVSAKIEQFWDATLLKSPNRIKNLLKLEGTGAFAHNPTREEVLDRKTQNLAISPNAQAVVATCQNVVAGASVFSTALITSKVIGSLFARAQVLNAVLKPWMLVVSLGVSGLINGLARKIKAEYYFKYTDDYRKRDIAGIPKSIWLDK